MLTLSLENEAQTRAVAGVLAGVLVAETRALGRSVVVFIRGELGAGKSTLVRGLLRRLGVSGVIPSPTYSLVESYVAQEIPVLHMDAYRLTDALELDFLGIDGVFSQPGIVLVEWPDQVATALPAPDLQIHLTHQRDQPEGRTMTVLANWNHDAALVAFELAGLESVVSQVPT